MLTLLRLAGMPGARRGAHAPRSAGDDRRRGDVREPGAAGAVRRRDRRRRGRGADSAAAARRSSRRPTATTCCGGSPPSAASTCRRSTTCSYADDGTIAAFVPRAGTGAPPVVQEGRAQDDRGRRSAGDDDLHARHRVRLALPGRGRARLRQPVPLLLGGLQLPAGARVSRRSASCELAEARAAALEPRRASCRSRCAITRRSRRSSRGWSTMGYSISPASLRLDDLTPTILRLLRAERRADDHDRPGSRLRSPAPRHQQDGDQRRDPRRRRS